MSGGRLLLKTLLIYGLIHGIFCAPTGSQEYVAHDSMSTKFSSGPLFIFLFYVLPWTTVMFFLVFVMCRLSRHIRWLNWCQDREPTQFGHKINWCDCMIDIFIADLFD